MTALQILVAPETSAQVPPGASPVFVDAVYSRAIKGKTTPGVADLPNNVQETLRFVLDHDLRGSITLVDPVPASDIELRFLGGDGVTRLSRQVVFGADPQLPVALSQADMVEVTAADPQPPPAPPQVLRRAQLVASSDVVVPFRMSHLQLAPIKVGSGGWAALGLGELLHSDAPVTASVPWPMGGWPGAGAISWMPTHLAVDGQFSFDVEQGAGEAWIWWLAGPLSAVGVVIDDLNTARVVLTSVPLPPFSGDELPVDVTGRVPADVTEAEVAGNPGVYSEDPGAFCRPFSNPERVLGEKSFSVVLRAEQPVISAEASVVVDPLPTLRFDVLAADRVAATEGRITARAGRAALPPGGVIADGPDVTFERHALPSAYVEMLKRFNRGRTEMDASHPVQWESDASRYQATTVARGHILEYRMRWRSNGYSLGTVAKTLTLAPRQQRRIQKVEWSRVEATQRQESTRLQDAVSDTVQRDRNYDDAVQSNLSEWSRGESHSSTQGGAVGAGFAAGGFVIGGGGVESSAQSDSSQDGGRRVSASEEQRLQDSIRRYGDSLRRLESTVVTEVSQEETVTGTTEVVRNQNYAHSLTVIYYQILRHLRIETAVAGVRECLFVPFSIKPFIMARAYRWRDLILSGLRDRRHAPALTYLKDVMTNFATSTVPPGRRSDQPIDYIFGSLFVKLAIDRPRDTADGDFDPATWARLQPFLGAPALAVYTALKARFEAERDAVFQRDHAPTIAASWVDTLLFEAGGATMHADFTIATRYQFNGRVRIDFSIPNPTGQTPVTRELLADIRIRATTDLPPGSVANLESISFTYQTAQFQHSVSASQGSGDLVHVETGLVDTQGATVGTIPDTWERQNIRAEMIEAVGSLIEHLNDHVEYYHKVIWWGMDRDRLFMLIDGFYVPGTNGVSIASVVERDPIAIIGNAVVFRVSSGAFLGMGSLMTPADLFNHYVSLDAPNEPILVSLPTDGLYAQAVMDECGALEEHFGNTDWALNDPDLDLGTIAPELLTTRRADPVATDPTTLPQTIINLQNAPEAPTPAGLAGVLQAATTANAFRDMAGLAGTQANAAAAFQAAATLASSFGAQAAALKMAETANNAHATQTADQKLATVQRAVDRNLTTPADAQQHASKILEGLHPQAASRPDPAAVLAQPIFASASSIKATTPEYELEASLGGGGGAGGGGRGAGGGGRGAPAAVGPFPAHLQLPLQMADADLDNCIESASAPADLHDLCGAIADLTDDPGLPPLASHNPVDMLYVGSMAKMYAMYAAFELRKRVEIQAKDMIANGLSTANAGWEKQVVAALKAAWQPTLDAAFPNLPSKFPALDQIVALSATGDASLVASDPPRSFAQLAAIGEFGNPPAEFLDCLQLALGWSNNAAASRCILALSYPYINGVLGSAGFFDKTTNSGLWISGDYAGHDWLDNDQAGRPLTPRWALPGHAVSNFTGTVFQVARFMTLLAQGKLVDSASSAKMIEILGTPFMDEGLTNATPPRNFSSIVGKVGIGTWDARYHDCAIVTVDRPGHPDSPIRYAIAVLGSPANADKLQKLEVAYHDCILARHP